MLGIDIELYNSANLNLAILGDTPQDTQVHSRKFNICLSFFEMQLMSGTEISRQFKTSLPQSPPKLLRSGGPIRNNILVYSYT